jgi:hypothetical protein
LRERLIIAAGIFAVRFGSELILLRRVAGFVQIAHVKIFLRFGQPGWSSSPKTPRSMSSHRSGPESRDRWPSKQAPREEVFFCEKAFILGDIDGQVVE